MALRTSVNLGIPMLFDITLVDRDGAVYFRVSFHQKNDGSAASASDDLAGHYGASGYELWRDNRLVIKKPFPEPSS